MINPTKALQTYLDTNDLTHKAFGERLGVKQSIVSRWISGDATPSVLMAMAIERETKIPAEAWRDDLTELARMRKGAA